MNIGAGTSIAAMQRKGSVDNGMEDNETISKMADLRVSNALIINNKFKKRKKDQLIKGMLLDDNDIIT
jgi:hypothetical protein